MNNEHLEKLLNKYRFLDTYSPENTVRGLDILIKKYLSDNTIMAEVGCFAGVSSELFAIHVKHIYCIDPYLEYSETMGSNIKNAENLFNELLLSYSNITKIKKSSTQAALEDFDDSSLDFVYIDGAHDYDSVYQDIKYWLPKIKISGFIGGHDIGNHNVYKAINNHGLNIIETFSEQSWIAYPKN